MDMFDQLDPSLFGLWDDVPMADAAGMETGFRLTGTLAEEDLPLVGTVKAEADRVLLELKSADAEAAQGSDDLRLLLSEMTRELRAEFIAFRQMRSNAEGLAADGDEAAQKLARADLKAATDAMSLIVRTLEKVDSLQRQLARDRAAEAERLAEETGYEEALHDVQALIEQRALELWQKRQRAESAEGEPGGVPGDKPPSPDSS
ncbi:hypothetical protein AAIH46_08830 [Rhizobium sp. 0TCS1.26]|uniref:hypothetical protein n=1 Tax=Rhizobium sp. 0TCS1.26 TaxID=3142623 RepID=UPI003D2CC096